MVRIAPPNQPKGNQESFLGVGAGLEALEFVGVQQDTKAKHQSSTLRRLTYYQGPLSKMQASSKVSQQRAELGTFLGNLCFVLRLVAIEGRKYTFGDIQHGNKRSNSVGASQAKLRRIESDVSGSSATGEFRCQVRGGSSF